MTTQNNVYTLSRADTRDLIAIFTSKQLAIESLVLSYSNRPNISWQHKDNLSVCRYIAKNGRTIVREYRIDAVKPINHIEHL